jgi:hypothetical protein
MQPDKWYTNITNEVIPNEKETLTEIWEPLK